MAPLFPPTVRFPRNFWGICGRRVGRIFIRSLPRRTEILKSRNTDAVGMVKFGERFFVSLGFDPLPETFWKRSMFVRPRDREVVCHASAWSIDFRNDLRVKMCIQINDEDFTTVHHELGHNFY